MYEWMSVAGILKFVAAFYPTWDRAEADRLVAKLGLPPRERIKNLSRGMKGQLALVLALAHRPELLILDEPTAGLDLKVRKDFLEGVIELIQQEGRTVFFSSHQIEDVERIADRAVFLRQGRVSAAGDLEDLRSRAKRVRAVFSCDIPAVLPAPAGWERIDTTGREVAWIVDPFSPEGLAQTTLGLPLAGEPVIEALTLEDLFMHYAVEPKGGSTT